MKKYFKPMMKVVKVEEKETVLTGSVDGVGVQISDKDKGTDSRSGIRGATSEEVNNGLGFAKSSSFDDEE